MCPICSAKNFPKRSSPKPFRKRWIHWTRPHGLSCSRLMKTRLVAATLFTSKEHRRATSPTRSIELCVRIHIMLTAEIWGSFCHFGCSLSRNAALKFLRTGKRRRAQPWAASSRRWLAGYPVGRVFLPGHTFQRVNWNGNLRKPLPGVGLFPMEMWRTDDFVTWRGEGAPSRSSGSALFLVPLRIFFLDEGGEGRTYHLADRAVLRRFRLLANLTD